MPNKQTIDDFFKPTSMDVAEKIIGMAIEYRDGIYTVTATKPYFGDSKQTQSKSRLMHGGIMMFNIRGHPHFCVSTGTGVEQDYFLIHNVIAPDSTKIRTASAVSEALGLRFGHDGHRFSDYFGLRGTTKPSIFIRREGDASSCLGIYELRK